MGAKHSCVTVKLWDERKMKKCNLLDYRLDFALKSKMTIFTSLKTTHNFFILMFFYSHTLIDLLNVN